MEYPIAGTPCEGVISGEVCLYPENIQALFPEDQMLVEIGAESYIGVPVLDSTKGKPIGLLAICHDLPLENVSQDVSILKIFASRVEAEMKRQRAENDLIMFSKKLQISNKNLEEFAYLASHDMQEPLRKIVNFGERLRERLDDDLGVQYLEKMQTAAERMKRLIFDLLELSRVNTKQNSFESCSLTSVAKDAIDDLENLVAQTKGKVTINSLPKIKADRTQMHKIFQNHRILTRRD